MTDLVGTTLKKQYFLRELAGRGGMADVYLAWDNLRSTKMAVKILRRDLASSREFKESLAKEFELLRKLEHPNIVRVFDFESRGKDVFIVMAWVDGGNLRQRIDALGRPFSLAEAAAVLEPVCSALNFAHNMGAFHCDIKPSNIMLHQNGRDVFLADFGVARLASEKGGGGTPPYMAPEQFTRRISAQTDIYALGVTVYEMLSGGMLPYHGDSQSPGNTTRDRYAWEHQNLPLPPLQGFNRSLPQAVLDVVDKALQKDPARRFDSALGFGKAFERAAGNPRPVPPVESPTIFEPRETQKSTVDQKAPPRTPVHTRDRARKMSPIGAAASYLVGRSGEWTGRTIPISNQTTSIGRSSSCQIRLQERSVSRSHATIIVTKRGIYLRDDGSSLGTLLNGVRIAVNAPVSLHNGDVIQIGYYQIFEFHAK